MTDAAARDLVYLGHMLEAIAKIRRFVGRKRRAGFLADPLLQDAVMRNIEIIGEAGGRVSREFSSLHVFIPWRDIAGMRHRLIHGYMQVNLGTVWQVVERDLPALEKSLAALQQKSAAPTARKGAGRDRRPRRRSRSLARSRRGPRK